VPGAVLTTGVFERMGFGPELTAATKRHSRRERIIRLHACPVGDLARSHPELSCAVHLGLLQGLHAEHAKV